MELIDEVERGPGRVLNVNYTQSGLSAFPLVGIELVKLMDVGHLLSHYLHLSSAQPVTPDIVDQEQSPVAPVVVGPFVMPVDCGSVPSAFLLLLKI